MKEYSRFIAVPEWKQFIKMGEELLNLPDTAEQCKFIEKNISDHLHCEAKIWLVEPLYPLPGENGTDTIPSIPPTEILRRVYETNKVVYQAEPEAAIEFYIAHCDAKIVAYPLTTKDQLLAVVLLQRHDQPFSEKDFGYLDAFLTMFSLAMEVSRQVSLKNWRAKQLSLIQTVSEQIANMTDLSDLCERVTNLIRELFDLYYVAIYIFSEESQDFQLQSMQAHENCSDFSPAFSVKPDQGIIGYVGHSGQELHAVDVKNEARYRHIDCLPETQSEIALPLRTEDHIYGVLDIQSNKMNGFHQNDLVVLRALANNISLAIESTDLYQNLQQRINQINTVVEFNQSLTSILDLEKLIEKVASLIHERFGYPYIHLYTLNPIQNKINFGTGVGKRSERMYEQAISYDLDDPQGIIPWVARQGKKYLSNDVSIDPVFRKLGIIEDNTKSELTVPIIYGDEVFGILDIQSDRKNTFQKNDVELMEAMASSVAIAIRNAFLYRSEKWRVQVADSFRDVSELISANKPLDDVLDAILDKLNQNLPCDASAIWLLSESETENNNNASLTPAAVYGVDAEKLSETLRNEETRAMLDRAINNHGPIIRHATDQSGPLGESLAFSKDYSSIAAPLRAGDQTLGLLTLAHNTAGRYGNEAQDMTATFASYAAVAIQNTRLFEEAQEQAWVSTVLLQVAEASQAASTVEELLTTMVRLPPLLIGVKLSAIFIWEDDNDAFHLKNWYGSCDPPSQTHFFEYDTPALAKLNAIRSAIFIDDPEQELNLPADTISDDVSTMIMVPLVSRGTLLGAFLVGYQQRPYATSENDLNQQILAILQGITHQTAVSIENLRMEESQEEEAYVTAVLLEVAQAVVSQNDLNDVLDTIVHLMPILVGIETCVIYLWDDKKHALIPEQSYAGNDEDEINLLQQAYGPGAFPLLDETLKSNHLHFSTNNTNNLSIKHWVNLPFHPEEDLSSTTVFFGGSILLSVPLTAKGEVFGIMLAKETMTSLAFQEKRMEIITGIAQQVALAIQNEKFKQEMVETQRIEQEIELARKSQQTFLPGEFPRLYRWDLDARWKPARLVGGDFYDIIQLDRDKIGLVIADVADKGMAAALYMTVTQTLIRAYSQNETSPSAVLEQVNNLLMPSSQDGMFVTAFYAILSKRNNRVTYANAGHNLPLLMKNATNQVELLKKGGISLGVLEDIDLEDHEISIDPGDLLLLYTDGVTEAFSENGDTFGDERLNEFMINHKDQSALKFLDELEMSIKIFAGDVPPSDDITLVCLKRQS